MALDMEDSNNIASFHQKRDPPRDPAFESGVHGYDVEKTEECGRKMSRLGGPSAIGITDSEAGSMASVGKQVEMEAANSIKYRTCSWQKVIGTPSFGFAGMMPVTRTFVCMGFFMQRRFVRGRINSDLL